MKHIFIDFSHISKGNKSSFSHTHVVYLRTCNKKILPWEIYFKFPFAITQFKLYILVLLLFLFCVLHCIVILLIVEKRERGAPSILFVYFEQIGYPPPMLLCHINLTVHTFSRHIQRKTIETYFMFCLCFLSYTRTM